MSEESLVFRLRERARIRRQIPTRKSVLLGQPDRLADLLEEAADEIERLTNRPSQDNIIQEIHRRAEKEWSVDGYDFNVAVTSEDYKALCEEKENRQ